MAKKTTAFVEDFAFYEQLWNFYDTNRGKIRSRYNDLTKKFLAYNDKKENPEAFLRQPQFEALASMDETKALTHTQIAFSGVEEDILRARTPGFMRMLTMSNRFVIPVQANLYAPQRGE